MSISKEAKCLASWEPPSCSLTLSWAHVGGLRVHQSNGRIFSQRLALHEINTSRYNEEFHELCRLGDGQFGSVYKCINRLDGCVYAIKKSKTPVAGSAYE